MKAEEGGLYLFIYLFISVNEAQGETCLDGHLRPWEKQDEGLSLLTSMLGLFPKQSLWRGLLWPPHEGSGWRVG